MSGIFTPTPADESFKVLRAVPRHHGQFSIENGDGLAHSEFSQQYVRLSGYCGPHNPWVFAAAPELYVALDNLADFCEQVFVKPAENPELIEALRVLAKARGEASA